MSRFIDSNKKPTPLLLSGYNPRAVIALCRFFSENNIRFFIVARDANDPILASDYKKLIIHIRTSSSLHVEHFLEWKKKTESEPLLILPTAEYLNRFLLNNRERLEQEGFLIPLCERQLYEEISDKLSFSRLCERYNLKIPLQSDDLTTLPLPLVAKPRSYMNPNGKILKPELLFTQRACNEFIKTKDRKDFYFQEFIEGQSIYLLYYFSTTGEYSVFSQENFIQQHGGLSMIAAESSRHYQDSISKDYAQIFLEKGFNGFVMIELKGQPNKYAMIEANPRIWGPFQLLLDSGTDLIHRFAKDFRLIQSIPSRTYLQGQEYFWSGGLFEDLTHGEKPAFHNFDEKKFFSRIEKFFAADIYGRQDTWKIYMEEKHGTHA